MNRVHAHLKKRHHGTECFWSIACAGLQDNVDVGRTFFICREATINVGMRKLFRGNDPL